MKRAFTNTVAFAAATIWGAAAAQNATVTVNIDASANRHVISPYVYGVAFGNSATLADLNAPLNRYGGNATSRYNWQQNADNRGQDWYFESLGDPSPTAGERGDTFISTSRGAGAQPMITVPIIDWLAKVGSGRGKLASFSQTTYGPQTGNDWQWYPDAGNGVSKSTGFNITGNDPNDANVPNGYSLARARSPGRTTRRRGRSCRARVAVQPNNVHFQLPTDSRTCRIRFPARASQLADPRHLPIGANFQ